jgi:hypothetical protein
LSIDDATSLVAGLDDWFWYFLPLLARDIVLLLGF